MRSKTEKQVLKFLGYLKSLEVIEAVGVARFLGVELLVREDGIDGDNQPKASITEKDYDVILSEMIDAFIQCNDNKRKVILNIMKDATRD